MELLELLHMDPKSPEAQVFYQLNKSTSKIGPSPALTPSGNDIIAMKLCLLLVRVLNSASSGCSYIKIFEIVKNYIQIRLISLV